MKKWLIIILALIVFGVLFFKWFFNHPCEPPEKPKNVPIEAVWSGDCDGGYWIELVDIKKNVYRFRIYQDWNGELKMDADFVFKDGKTELTRENWKDVVCCYSHSTDSLVKLSVIKAVKGKKNYYRLESLYPAYGGDDWEIIKEKYKINR